MVVGAEPYCFRMRLENKKFLHPTYCKRLVRMVERGLEDFVVKTRVTPTIGEEN
jgi:hypothetical protein